MRTEETGEEGGGGRAIIDLWDIQTPRWFNRPNSLKLTPLWKRIVEILYTTADIDGFLQRIKQDNTRATALTAL